MLRFGARAQRDASTAAQQQELIIDESHVALSFSVLVGGFGKGLLSAASKRSQSSNAAAGPVRRGRILAGPTGGSNTAGGRAEPGAPILSVTLSGDTKPDTVNDSD